MSARRQSEWHDYDFVVQMPHQAPGGRLSEVEFFKVLGAFQWESIARSLGQRPSRIASEHGDRLYASFTDVELRFAGAGSQESFGEDVTLHIRHRVRFYAKKFVEGLFLFDARPIPDAVVEAVASREDLSKTGLSWACMTNAFIAREGSNTRLKVFKPAGADTANLPELREPPAGVTNQARVQGTGDMPRFESHADGPRLRAARTAPIVYDIRPENDLNGAGLVYFARYPAMMNHGERVFLTERLDPPWSLPLVSYLSTEHRQIYYFANAAPEDRVQVRVRAALAVPEQAVTSGDYRVPFKLNLRIDLYRASDKVLMASGLVRKALKVPGHAKPVLTEADRLLRGLR